MSGSDAIRSELFSNEERAQIYNNIVTRGRRLGDVGSFLAHVLLGGNYGDVAEFLMMAFPWGEADEGTYYWIDIYERVVRGVQHVQHDKMSPKRNIGRLDSSMTFCQW